MPLDSAFETIAAAREVSIETRRDDQTFETVVWVVRVDGTLYVRSYLAHEAHWYRRARANPLVALTANGERLEFTAVLVTDPDVIAAVSDAFVAKYPSGRSRDAMVRDEVLDTTLLLEPR